jgi:hypothetical protein
MNLKRNLMCISLLSALAICQSLTTGVQAATIGSQGFVSLGTITADPTADITTARDFTLGDVVTNASNTGIFSGMPSQAFGSISFEPGIDTSFMFGNSVFGNFASTSITKTLGPFDTVIFTEMGDWTPGTYCAGTGCPLTGGPFLAAFTANLTQTGGTGNAISGSFTFATTNETPSEIPLPATLPLMGSVLGLVGLQAGWRKRRSKQVAVGK